MSRRKRIVNWLDLRDKILTRIATEENAGVLHDLLICYQEVISIMEHRKALKKVKPAPTVLAVLAKPKLAGMK